MTEKFALLDRQNGIVATVYVSDVQLPTAKLTTGFDVSCMRLVE